MTITKSTIILRLKEDDNSQAWREFEAIYRPLLVRYARECGLDSFEAEDIAQECLTEVYRHINRFVYDKQRGGLKRWLRVMAKRRVINQRRKRRAFQAESGEFDRPQEREVLPEDAFEAIWLSEHLRYCLERIREEVQPQTCEAFQRLALDGWPVEKVCRTYDITPNNAYAIKARLTGRMRTLMAEIIGEPE